MRHAVLVSIYYEPELTGIAPYSVALAGVLEEVYGRVTVITGVPHFPNWTVPENYRKWRIYRAATASSRHVVRLRHFVPRNHTVMGRALYEMSFLPAAAFVPGHVDVVIGVVPTLSAGVVAAGCAAASRVPLGLLVQDLTSSAVSQSGLSRSRVLPSLLARAEAAILKKANRVAVVSDAFREQLVRIGVHRDRICTVPNWTHTKAANVERDEIRDSLGWPRDAYIVLHSGNMGFKQALEYVVDAAVVAASAQSNDLRFVLMGSGNQRRFVERRAAGLRNVHILDCVPDDIYPSVLRAADALLVNERSSVEDMCLPSKITSYLAAGKPIVAAVNPEGATARELRRSGGALLVQPERPLELLKGISRLRTDVALVDQLIRSGTEYVSARLTLAMGLDRTREFVRSLA